jgi:hypothetical protein
LAVVTWRASRWVAAQVLLAGLVYPWVAGLDSDRAPLYLNICAAVLVAVTAWQLARRLRAGD